MTQLNLQLADGTVRPVPADVAVLPVTTGATPKTLTFNNVKTIQVVKSVSIVSTTNVRRAPSGAVTFSGNVLSIADAAYANGETIIAEVIGYSS
jgi:hypothetical protein